MIYSGPGPNYETFYESTLSNFNSDFGYHVGYRLPGGTIGQAMNPTVANQLAETMKTLKTGVKQVEVQMLGPPTNNVGQQIPKQHFKEIRGLLKLSGATPSLHGPIIDAAGMGQRGANEETRLENQRRFVDAIEKAHELDPKGNTHVVFHASAGMPGPLFKVDKTKKPGEKGRFVVQQNFGINQETGEPVPLRLEKEYMPYPDYKTDPKHPYIGEFTGAGNDFTPKQQLRSINSSEWRRTMTNLAEYNKHAEEIMGNSALFLGEFQNAYIKRNPQTGQSEGIFDAKTGKELYLTNEQQGYYQNLLKADVFLDNVSLSFNNAFSKAYKYAEDEEQKKYLKEIANDYLEGLRKINSDPLKASFLEPLQKKELLQKSISLLNQVTYHTPPKTIVDAQTYALDKASETFSQSALEAYDKFGKTMPVIAIENYEPGTSFHRAKDLKKLIETTREKFIDKLSKEKGVSKSEAKKIAESQIGATWDVGHVNFHKKYGFNDEDILLETKEIAPMVKHLHLTDNFGYSDSHLVPGMGNVPFKEHLEKLEKAGVLNKVRKVVEAGGYTQHISQMGTHGDALAAFGSPIYGMKMAPFWNQSIALRGNYFGGYGTLNPQTHHSVYGSGFSSMPTELGGNIPGGGSRFSGNPMA